jgi:pimeloyl-ACP methyl ester carboxylesterase
MVHLLAVLGRERAVWVGHDWGSPVVWNIASHYPEKCVAIANLCVPYWTLERGLNHTLQYVNKEIYDDSTPAGQWEYMRFYEENFAKAHSVMDVNPYNTAKALFRKGNPAAVGIPSGTSKTRQEGGWFGGATEAPDVPRDADVVTEADLCTYAAALGRNGFFGPDSWYMNHEKNLSYAERARDGGFLKMPVLFIAAAYDTTCECPALSRAQSEHIQDLTYKTIQCGHWMAQEKPQELNAVLVQWLAAHVETGWPQPRM